MSRALLPPKPWCLEIVGLAAAVTFSHPDGRSLIWVDGCWYVGKIHAMKTAPGVPGAESMDDARDVGCRWLTDLEDVA